MRKFLSALLCAMLLTGCMGEPDAAPEVREISEIPARLVRDDGGVPMLSVYHVQEEELVEMDVEEYVMGVVAGEMRNDWPLEALKAQAILARTYVMNFVSNKTSSYEGADISTDVTEAQAYAPASVNDAVRRAVEETRGLVLSYRGEFPYAWFHAHAGGVTELASVALNYKTDPEYIAVTESPDSDHAPEDVQNWTASFTREQVRQAAADAGADIGEVESVAIGKTGESGRAAEFLINGVTVSAPEFRIHIGPTELKSTLIDGVEVDDDRIVFTGRGFGHGVGMSQWGAYGMAEDGKSAEEIILHYFRNVELVNIWN